MNSSVIVLFLAAAFLLPGAGRAGDGPTATWGRAAEEPSIFLPDPAATPGRVALGAKASVCSVSWGRDARHVTPKMKRDVCAAYGARNCPGKAWEVDHLISRELGGKDDERNLWAQPIKQARMKDRLENWAHREVCAGRLKLEDVQQRIAQDWFIFYKQMLKESQSR